MSQQSLAGQARVHTPDVSLPLVDGKQLGAVLRIKALWASALLRVARFLLGRSGSAGQPQVLLPAGRGGVAPVIEDKKLAEECVARDYMRST